MRVLLCFISCCLLVSCSGQKNHELNSNSNTGIMGGHDLKEGDELTSHIVAVWDVKNEFLCTGTLISPNVVVTAAHCVVGKANQLKVMFGPDAFMSLNAREVDVQQEFVRRVVAAKAHEGYIRDEEKMPQIDQNDIALIRFAGSLPAGYKPAEILKEKKALSQGVMATVAGYGVSKVETFPIDLKNYSKKKFIDGLDSGQIACDDKMTACFEVEMKGDGTLRAAQAAIKALTQTEVRLDESKGQGTCSGDSGGPAFVQRDGAYFLFGVTSRGNLLCNEEGVYTNVVEHMTWIEKTLKSL